MSRSGRFFFARSKLGFLFVSHWALTRTIRHQSTAPSILRSNIKLVFGDLSCPSRGDSSRTIYTIHILRCPGFAISIHCMCAALVCPMTDTAMLKVRFRYIPFMRDTASGRFSFRTRIVLCG